MRKKKSEIKEHIKDIYKYLAIFNIKAPVVAKKAKVGKLYTVIHIEKIIKLLIILIEEFHSTITEITDEITITTTL